MLVNFFIALFLIILLLIYSITPERSRKSNMAKYDHSYFAHRGYHNKDLGIPENSMAAFRAAIEHGYGIEIDIHATKDGKVVVFHDDNLKRLCGVDGMVESYTLQELQQFRLYNTDERIPEFQAFLDFVDGRVPLLIELKIPGRDISVCPASYEILKHYKGDYLIQSFNTLGLRWYRKNASHILRGQLSSNLVKSDPDKPLILRFMVRYLLMNFLGKPDFISYKLADLPNLGVTICQKIFNIPIAVWTLRTPKSLRKGEKYYNICIFEKKGENY